MVIGDIVSVIATPRQLENIGVGEDEIIGAKVEVIKIYNTGYICVEWLSPNFGIIQYDIPKWFLLKINN